LVLTALAFLGFGLLFPISQSGQTSGNINYRNSFIRDLGNPRCSEYLTKPFRELKEPEFGVGGTCWHIYTSRRFEEQDVYPYSLEQYDKKSRQHQLRFLAEMVAICGGVVLFLSVTLYGLGLLIAWIRRGFVKPV